MKSATPPNGHMPQRPASEREFIMRFTSMGDRDSALEALEEAWNVAPEMARVHPTSQELMHVLTSLHRRSNPRLTRLAKRAGMPSEALLPHAWVP
ncbi:hypothetical protein ACWD48_33370 [Streptomyces sp. NPDC002519]